MDKFNMRPAATPLFLKKHFHFYSESFILYHLYSLSRPFFN